MWEAAVWKFIFGRKSAAGNWWERRFRWKWSAYVAARFMAIICDIVTPRGWMIDHGCGPEWTENEVGIAWGIRPVEKKL